MLEQNKNIVKETVKKVIEIQKIYGRSITGNEKHNKVISGIKNMFNELDLDNEFLNELIEVIVELVKNKKIHKLFKKGFGVCF